MKRFINFATKIPYIQEVFVFVLMLALYLPLQASGSFADPDSFYHLKMAELIAARGPIRDFIWLPFTTLASSYADHHFLYHVLLIPFIKIFGSFSGMKIATAAFAALAIAGLSWSMRSLRIRFSMLFAILTGIMAPFIFRIGLGKASALGVLLLVVGLTLALRRRAWPLALVAFIYVWTHGGWPALLVLGTLAIIVISWKGGPRATCHALRAPLAALWLGTLAGLVINPFFPANLKFYWEQIVQIAVVNYSDKIGVGAEWYPYAPGQLASGLALLCFLAAVVVVVIPLVLLKEKDRERIKISSMLTAAAVLFLFLTLRSKRHVEYFVPLAVFALASWLTELRVASFWLRAKRQIVTLILGSCCLIAISGTFAYHDLVKTRQDLSGGYDLDLYKKAAQYLKANTLPGEIVVHADWDDFPPLFYWDDQNRYIMGLDPTFLYRQDPGLYRRYVDLTLGRSADPAGVMNELGSRWVFADRVHADLDKTLKGSGRFERVYIDSEAEIYLFK